MKTEKFEPDSLRDFLWENMQRLKDGTLTAKDANAMSGSARVIIQDAKLKLEAIKLSGKVDKKNLKQLGILK